MVLEQIIIIVYPQSKKRINERERERDIVPKREVTVTRVG
jgi:hypothetical protein